MKTKTLALTLISGLLITTLARMEFIDSVAAPPPNFADLPRLTVKLLSPVEGATYDTKAIKLSFSYECANLNSVIEPPLFTFYLDGKRFMPILVAAEPYNASQTLEYYLNLTEGMNGDYPGGRYVPLSEGWHAISIGMIMFYNTTIVRYLAHNWFGSYWSTAHAGSIRVDSYSQVVNFAVSSSPSPPPSSSTPPPAKTEPFPTTVVLAATGASATIAGIALLVYFKKRKH